MEEIFKGIFDSPTQQVVGVGNFLLCVGVSIAVGILLAFLYSYKTKHTKSFFITLSVLPAVVCVVIMMVNGNIGAGVAVAGAFSLIRFRSAPGTAKEIAAIFLAMGAGIIIGMGYIGYGVLFAVVLGLLMFGLNFIKCAGKNSTKEKTLKITIPEDLNYTEVFTEVFNEYTKENELVHVKTTNLGSMFRLTYNVVLKDDKNEKAFIDEIRTKNGNLEVAIMNRENVIGEL